MFTVALSCFPPKKEIGACLGAMAAGGVLGGLYRQVNPIVSDNVNIVNGAIFGGCFYILDSIATVALEALFNKAKQKQSSSDSSDSQDVESLKKKEGNPKKYQNRSIMPLLVYGIVFAAETGLSFYATSKLSKINAIDYAVLTCGTALFSIAKASGCKISSLESTKKLIKKISTAKKSIPRLRFQQPEIAFTIERHGELLSLINSSYECPPELKEELKKRLEELERENNIIKESLKIERGQIQESTNKEAELLKKQKPIEIEKKLISLIFKNVSIDDDEKQKLLKAFEKRKSSQSKSSSDLKEKV